MDVFVAHHACISYVDWCVGQVLDCVKSSGLEDNTIIVFTTDHGFMLGEHWSWRKNQNKHWEETCRIPYIWKVPGVTPSNTRSTAMVEMIDSYPTFFDLAGIPLPEDELRALAGELKRRCGTGGSAKNGVIEIQGDHRETLAESLREKGYSVKLADG